jgi:hypothetical protein
MLYELMKQLMLGGELEFAEGKITFMGQHMQLLPASYFASRLKTSEDFWEEARLQYECMKKAIYSGWFSPVEKEKGLIRDDLTKWGVHYFNLGGYGKFGFEATQVGDGKALIKIENSAIATAYVQKFGKSKHPVCHIIRGGFAGGANKIINRNDLEVVETKCLAMGDPYCEVLVNPRKELLKEIRGDYKNQISTSY